MRRKMMLPSDVYRASPKLVLASFFLYKTVICLIAGFSIYLGYRLFILGVTGQASLSVNSTTVSGQLLNAAPGLFFAVGGIVVLCLVVLRGMEIGVAGNQERLPKQTLKR